MEDSGVGKVKAMFSDDLSVFSGMPAEEMAQMSKAAGGVLAWLIAMIKYHEVAKDVGPLRRKVAAAAEEQAQRKKELAEIEAQIEGCRKANATLLFD